MKKKFIIIFFIIFWNFSYTIASNNEVWPYNTLKECTDIRNENDSKQWNYQDYDRSECYKNNTWYVYQICKKWEWCLNYENWIISDKSNLNDSLKNPFWDKMIKFKWKKIKLNSLYWKVQKIISNLELNKNKKEILVSLKEFSSKLSSIANKTKYKENNLVQNIVWYIAFEVNKEISIIKKEIQEETEDNWLDDFFHELEGEYKQCPKWFSRNTNNTNNEASKMCFKVWKIRNERCILPKWVKSPTITQWRLGNWKCFYFTPDFKKPISKIVSLDCGGWKLGNDKYCYKQYFWTSTNWKSDTLNDLNKSKVDLETKNNNKSNRDWWWWKTICRKSTTSYPIYYNPFTWKRYSKMNENMPTSIIKWDKCYIKYLPRAKIKLECPSWQIVPKINNPTCSKTFNVTISYTDKTIYSNYFSEKKNQIVQWIYQATTNEYQWNFKSTYWDVCEVEFWDKWMISEKNTNAHLMLLNNTKELTLWNPFKKGVNCSNFTNTSYYGNYWMIYKNDFKKSYRSYCSKLAKVACVLKDQNK